MTGENGDTPDAYYVDPNTSAATGGDVVVIEQGRISKIYGFFG
ncbi:hypothetical protein [Qaidamihabitans albus]|nr:hypothetical protein [Qaidamihabitans albus]